MAVQAKTFCRRGQVLDRVVEELVAVLERRALRDDVQEVELVHARPRGRARRSGRCTPTFCLLMQTSTFDDDASVAAARIMPFISRSKAPSTPVRRSCSSGVWPVQAERDLAETGLDGLQEEVALREHVAVGDGLHPAVADLAGVAHEVDELRMDRALAARQDDLVGVQLLAPAPELLWTSCSSR
jgi:hypothetical protein